MEELPGYLDAVLEEIKLAPTSLAIEGGSNIMAAIGAAVIAKIGYPISGRATVKIAIEDETSIIISWPEDD